MTLINHSKGQEKVVLTPLEKYYFSGQDHIHSMGECVDYNLISKVGLEAELDILGEDDFVIQPDTYVHLYAISDIQLYINDQSPVTISARDGVMGFSGTSQVQMHIKVLTATSSHHSLGIISTMSDK